MPPPFDPQQQRALPDAVANLGDWFMPDGDALTRQMHHYDPQRPVAVFLGPSLPLAEARQKLAANYYPPVRMGDVYRLLATGVQTIAIIDGVFHQTTPVWQREILTALEEGIRVVGGGSMGALRAAELAPFGMEGVGTIYEWYAQGRIDSDDEVALLHTDESFGYRALSVPLVNMRFNLDAALAAGLLTADDHGALLAAASRQCFTERNWESMARSAPFLAMPHTRRDALATFLQEASQDLKRSDALRVLARCAAAPDVRPAPPPRGRLSCFHAMRHVRQCSVGPGGALVSGEAVLHAANAEPEWLAPAIALAHLHFFLLQWLDTHALPRDATQLAPYRDAPGAKVAPQDLPHWLRANGMTAGEREEALTGRARVAWLLDQTPSELPLADPTPPPDAALIAQRVGVDVTATRHRLLTDRILADWASAHGIVCPEQDLADGIAHWETTTEATSPAAQQATPEATAAAIRSAVRSRALAAWLLARGPGYFGYGNWSLELALIRELQLSGRYAELAIDLATELAVSP